MLMGGVLRHVTKRQRINRLYGLVPTVGSWDVDPTNLANTTDGDWNTETGEGVKSLAGADGLIGTLTWDMGAPYPVWVTVHQNTHRHWGDGWVFTEIRSSPDGVTYYSAGVRHQDVFADVYKPIHPAFLYSRYVRLLYYSDLVTVNPSIFHVKVAEVQALQFL